MDIVVILWITILSGPMADFTYGIIYYSEEACLEAKPQIGDSLDYDYSMECVVSGVPT